MIDGCDVWMCMDLQFIERFYTLLTLEPLGVSNPLFGVPVPLLFFGFMAHKFELHL